MPTEEKEVRKGIHFYWYYLTLAAFLAFISINNYSQSIRVEALDIGLMISSRCLIHQF